MLHITRAYELAITGPEEWNIQSFLTGVLGLAKSDEVPGMPLKGNHADFSFRVIRTYGNSVETLPLFAATLFLAIATSASPAWVNGLAGLHERCG